MHAPGEWAWLGTGRVMNQMSSPRSLESAVLVPTGKPRMSLHNLKQTAVTARRPRARPACGQTGPGPSGMLGTAVDSPQGRRLGVLRSCSVAESSLQRAKSPSGIFNLRQPILSGLASQSCLYG
jgi:hypothetical protein